ncbi:hypothetical protein J6590_030249 [Homalodisca vitripennis]|nr:hypothetical protein J6590_030249 [Homalodisca vitripennis]
MSPISISLVRRSHFDSSAGRSHDLDVSQEYAAAQRVATENKEQQEYRLEEKDVETEDLVEL